MLIESLRDYQIKALDELRDGVRKGHRSQILVAPTGAGKCLAKDTPILMANGRIIPVQFVFPQDKIMGDDGTPRTVLSIARGREKMFRVVPIKGDPYVVNASHILSLRKTFGTDGMVLSDGTKIPKDADIVNVRADVFFASNQTVKHNLKGWRCSGIQKFDRVDADLPIPPYILGAWIGDGTAKSPAISKYPCKMIDEWIAYGQSIGCSISTSYSYNGCPTHTLKSQDKTNQFTENLKKLRVFKNKHIPDIYKYADIKDRLEILAGMIDTDGSIDKSGCDWISKYEHLANDFVFIARSCGFSAYVSKQRKGIKSLGFSSDYWRVSLTGDLDRIPTRDKIFPVRNQKKRHLVTGITLEELPEDDYYGFEIDGNRLFCLGDFTVTHNTVSASYLLNEAKAKQNVAWFICDRVSLVDQTSATLDRYGVSHGVIQADHWRWRPYEYVQVISAQTLARRKIDNAPKLIVVDEAHVLHRSVINVIEKYPDAIVVGLTATPFTKGLSKIFTNVVNSTTTDKLINDGWLVPVKMFVAKSEMDMRGAEVKFDGEWAEKDMEKQGVEIVGDIVSEWIEATNKHFNGPVKTIVFSATVAHGEELCREFAQRGYNFQQISYKDGNNERRRELIEEFRKPDSDIIGLISCEALAKGFDVTDIKIGVCARPYRKSLSGHIQQMGRVMRPHPGKDFAVWLDHAGNLTRFWEDQVEVFAHGVQELEDGKLDAKVRKEPTEKEKAEIKCTACGYMFRGRVCPSCGSERRSMSNVFAVQGQMVEFGGTKSSDWMSDKRLVWWEIVQISKDRKRGDLAAAERFAKAQYKNLTGDWPKWKFHEAIFVEPRMVTQNKIKQQVIKYAKSKFGRRLV